MIKAILFDLDGTLLPMDQDEFTKGYFRLLAAKLAPYGYEPKTLIDTIWAGTAAMVKIPARRRTRLLSGRGFPGPTARRKRREISPSLKNFTPTIFNGQASSALGTTKPRKRSQSSNGSATASRSPQIRFSRASQPAPASAGQGSRRRISRL